MPEMGNSGAKVLAELARIHELARKLRDHLDQSQIELCRAFAQEILSSIAKVIATAQSSVAAAAAETEQLLSCQDLNGHQKKISNKRKILPKWTSHVSVGAGGGAEGPPDDGHCWRKYGQKDILGAIYPRAYYRCTHRKSHGCPAIKQVQRLDENKSVYEITYRGTHTCSLSPADAVTARSCLHDPQQSLLTDKAENSEDSDNQGPTFSFSVQSKSKKSETNSISSSPNPEFFSSAFMSLENSLSNCITLPDLTEIISSVNSEAESSVMNVQQFMVEDWEMDTEMPFDTSIFFA